MSGPEPLSGPRTSPGRRYYEDVADRIRAQIALGQLREGDRLPTERELAASLGFSRNTVREALRALEHAGLLEQRPGVTGGAFVRNSGATVIRTAFEDMVRLGTIQAGHLIEVRLVIGREMVRLACERRDDLDLAALGANVERTLAATEAGDAEARIRSSIEFHKLLARATRNPVLVLIVDVLTEITIELVRKVGPMPSDFWGLSQRRILDALHRRDRDSAIAEMETYLRTTLTRYFGALSDNSEAG